MGRPISQVGIIRKRTEVRYGRMRGKDEGVSVNISGPAYELAKRVEDWFQDPKGGQALKSFNSVGGAEVEVFLMETIVYLQEQRANRERLAKIATREEARAAKAAARTAKTAKPRGKTADAPTPAFLN